MNAIIVDVQSLFDIAISEVCDRILNKLQDIPALSSEACEPLYYKITLLVSTISNQHQFQLYVNFRLTPGLRSPVPLASTQDNMVQASIIEPYSIHHNHHTVS